MLLLMILILYGCFPIVFDTKQIINLHHNQQVSEQINSIGFR